MPLKSRIRLAQDELTKRGDLAAINKLKLTVEIDPDGTAWIGMGDAGVGLRYTLGEGWRAHDDGTDLTGESGPFEKAYHTGIHYMMVSALPPRHPQEKVLDCIMNRGWPAGF